MGTLRFDINAVADTLPKAAKKEVQAAKAEFLVSARGRGGGGGGGGGPAAGACMRGAAPGRRARRRRLPAPAQRAAPPSPLPQLSHPRPPPPPTPPPRSPHHRRRQAKVDKLDFAMRKKNPETAAAALAETKASLDAVLAKLV